MSPEVPGTQQAGAAPGTTGGQKYHLNLQRHGISTWDKEEQRGFEGADSGTGKEDRAFFDPWAPFLFSPHSQSHRAAADRFSPAAPALQSGQLSHGSAESPLSSASLAPISARRNGRKLDTGWGAASKCQAAGSLDGFLEGRGSQLLKRNFFTLLFCILPGQAFCDSVETKRQRT